MRIKGIRIKIASLIIAVISLIGAGIGIWADRAALPTSGDIRRIPIYSVATEEKKVALTFDAAWGNSDTDALIELLAEFEIKATFFVTGDWCDRCGDDVKRLAQAGHAIENHSDAHPHPNTLSSSALLADTKSCSDKIEALIGVRPTLYRAPYGEYNSEVVCTIEDKAGLRMIQWDADSLDWKRCGASAAAQNVLEKVQNGSILLFHNDIDTTVEAVRKTVTRLLAQGYRFVRVSELIDPDNYHLDVCGRQQPE